MEWVKIEDGFPDGKFRNIDGWSQKVIVHYRQGEIYNTRLGFYIDGKWDIDGNPPGAEVVCWMDMPELPEEEWKTN